MINLYTVHHVSQNVVLDIIRVIQGYIWRSGKKAWLQYVASLFCREIRAGALFLIKTRCGKYVKMREV